jgi:hypothetical protein
VDRRRPSASRTTYAFLEGPLFHRAPSGAP